MKKTTVIGFLGTTLDAGRGDDRWKRWRPTVAMCSHEDFVVDELVLLHDNKRRSLYERVVRDIKQISPETKVTSYVMKLEDPWDFEEVYGVLHDFAKSFEFKRQKNNYLINLTTGTHVAQICMYLLTEAFYFPAKLLQLSPPKDWATKEPGDYHIIDLDISRYSKIAKRFDQDKEEGTSFLKSGIATRNKAFNQMIEQIENVAIRSKAPLLLIGPTGAGKSQLAKRIYELKYTRHQIDGPFVEVNCATLRGDSAMSTLFGHVKGAFTGAVSERKGLLLSAHKGMLFLDEIGELGLDEQAIMLRAIEEGVFLPVGSDKDVESKFQLIAGTNRNLAKDVVSGRFREDLLARLNLWTFNLPGLKDRKEDIEPNLDFELERYCEDTGENVVMNMEARKAFLSFATSPQAKWSANFRDLAASVTRMAIFSSSGRIRQDIVSQEIQRLHDNWNGTFEDVSKNILIDVLGSEALQKIDSFDQPQLAHVISVCREVKSISEAGRALYNVSRKTKKTSNDADRLRKYLAKFGLDWDQVCSL